MYSRSGGVVQKLTILPTNRFVFPCPIYTARGHAHRTSFTNLDSDSTIWDVFHSTLLLYNHSYRNILEVGSVFRNYVSKASLVKEICSPGAFVTLREPVIAPRDDEEYSIGNLELRGRYESLSGSVKIL